MSCVASEDSAQPVQPGSLISLHCPHEEALGPWLSIKRLVKTPVRLPMHMLSESLLDIHAIL